MTRPRVSGPRTRLKRRPARRPEGGGAKKVALVTGAARGIGAATVKRLALDGLRRRRGRPRRGRPAAAVRARHRRGAARAARASASIRSPPTSRELAEVVEDAEQRWGGLDVIVAAAGVIAGGVAAWELDPEQEQAVLDVNLGGVLTAARVGIPALLRRPEPRDGRFIAVASAAATRGLPMLAAYCAAKAGVVGYVRALAVELGGTGVTANAVSPGSTRHDDPRGERAPVRDRVRRGVRRPAAARPPARARGGRRADRLARLAPEPRRDRRQLPARRRPRPVRLILDRDVRLFDGGRTLVARGRIIRLSERRPRRAARAARRHRHPGATAARRAPDRRRASPTRAPRRKRSTRRS